MLPDNPEKRSVDVFNVERVKVEPARVDAITIFILARSVVRVYIDNIPTLTVDAVVIPRLTVLPAIVEPIITSVIVIGTNNVLIIVLDISMIGTFIVLPTKDENPTVADVIVDKVNVDADRDTLISDDAIIVDVI